MPDVMLLISARFNLWAGDFAAAAAALDQAATTCPGSGPAADYAGYHALVDAVQGRLVLGDPAQMSPFPSHGPWSALETLSPAAGQ